MQACSSCRATDIRTQPRTTTGLAFTLRMAASPLLSPDLEEAQVSDSAAYFVTGELGTLTTPYQGQAAAAAAEVAARLRRHLGYPPPRPAPRPPVPFLRCRPRAQHAAAPRPAGLNVAEQATPAAKPARRAPRPSTPASPIRGACSRRCVVVVDCADRAKRIEPCSLQVRG